MKKKEMKAKENNKQNVKKYRRHFRLVAKGYIK